jgi:phospholipid/cholesterol/gamma-HCH transport system ATP-binding protein
MVLGLVRPDSGRVLVHDQEITGMSETDLMSVRKQIGMVFQEGALFDSLSVAENVAYRLREDHSQSEAELERTVRRVLGFVGLEHALYKMPSELSGGMRRRVAIARAVVGKPSIMLYDEPTAGLDPITARAICELIVKLRDLEGVSSILVTHDLSAAMTISAEMAVVGADGSVQFRPEGEDFCLSNTRFVMLKGGGVLFEGTDETLRSVDDEYIREFLT